jgi:hypothetical protein
MAAVSVCDGSAYRRMSALEQLSRTILLCRDYVIDELCDNEILRGFQSVRALCVSDALNLASHSGQTALVTLVSLLSRMGIQVEVRIPETTMLMRQPPLPGSLLLKALLGSTETLLEGSTVRCDSGLTPDLVFVLGNTKIARPHPLCWRLGGSEWDGTLTMENGSSSSAWKAEWPIGSMVSAALGANEAFKFVMRAFPLRQQPDCEYFEISRSCAWDFGTIAIPPDGIDLGRVDLISAGAICQAALFALMRIPRLRMQARAFDDDLTNFSNLNRNMLTLLSDVGELKVEVVARQGDERLQLVPVPNRFTATTPALTLAQRVLVGVDDIPSRWEIQRHAPGIVVVSGTTHFNVSSSAHSPKEPCSGCLHHVDDTGQNPIPTISFVSFWAGLAMAVRTLRNALGTSYARNRQQLWLTPLRMDQPNAAIWSPVPSYRNCPVSCPASRAA